ncbi:MAG: PEP-CTERM sorting domain-containing protein [Planctomycetes bacterium]|nr:PEP-CTERM sorting domain-containing protein [Planctomycetota bacterium]
MKKLLVVLMLLVVLCLASNSFALDLNPPDWRGQLATTLTIWEFLTPDINPVPDIQINPFGFADTTVYPAHPWEEIWGGMDGVWPLSGALEVKIPNNPVENELKLIQIQLTWSSEYPVPTQPVVMIDATRVNGQAVPQDDINLIGQQIIQLDPTYEPGASEFWYHTTYLFEIVPNPLFENIYISGSIMVDEVVIDTICIPEPATLALLSLGTVVFLRKKRFA